MQDQNAVITESKTEAETARRQGFKVEFRGAVTGGNKWTINKSKVLLIGRHTTGEIAPGVEVVAQEAVTFALSYDECAAQVKALVAKARELGADAMLFQNTPGILTATLMRMATTYLGDLSDISTAIGFRFGVIISVQRDDNRASVVTEYEFGDDCGFSAAHAIKARDAVLQANARAKTELRHEGNSHSYLTITVDPVTEFIFSHIEWM